jgi:hypothetical protein
MQQGEVAEGVNARDFNFNPFNDDGTINYDSQEVVFDISWNQPADYDLNTGLADPNLNGVKPNGTRRKQPQSNFTYTAIKCKNIFSKGRFEQELEGRLLIEYDSKNNAPADAGRPVPTATSAGAPSAAQIRAADTVISAGSAANTRGSSIGSEFGGQDELALATGSVESTPSTQIAAPQPLPTPAPLSSTSDADIININPVVANYTVPVKIGTLRLNNGRVVDFFESERGSYERALASGATPVVSNPQTSARET